MQIARESKLQPAIDDLRFRILFQFHSSSGLVEGDLLDAKLHEANGVDQRRVVVRVGVVDMQPDKTLVRHDVEHLRVSPLGVAIVVNALGGIPQL